MIFLFGMPCLSDLIEHLDQRGLAYGIGVLDLQPHFGEALLRPLEE